MKEYLFQVLNQEYKILAESDILALDIANKEIMTKLQIDKFTWFKISDTSWRAGVNQVNDSMYD
jgi:hypothetical protein